MSKEAEIIFKVRLDEENIPESIQWDATDSDIDGLKACSAMLISIWDNERKNSLSINLWTKEMTVEEINIHYIQTIFGLAETYRRATNNNEIAEMIKRFGREFADRATEGSSYTK